MKKSCIVFACTIFSQDRLHVLEEFIDTFRKDFADSDLYIGINPGSVIAVEDTLNKSNLNIVAQKRVNPELYSESDASAYQLALKLLKESGNQYENYWFVHTKGGVNSHSDYLRKWYISHFLENKIEIEQLLVSNPGIGSYGMLGLEFNPNFYYSEKDTQLPLFENLIIPQLPYPHINFFYIHTLYVIKGKIIQKFLSLITEEWFTTKLDRYYFEGVFPFIVSRSGYYPYLSNKRSMNGIDLSEVQSSWIIDNNFTSYTQYLEICKTDYPFHQLTPPHYVNSNP